MIRNAHRTVGAHVLAALAVSLGLPCTAAALPLISEVFYDASGSDNGLSFVELWGTPGTDLTDMTLEGVNGSNGAVAPTVTLSGVIPADGLFVVADDAGDGTSSVLEADLIANFDFQNGPDSIVLRGSGGDARDAIGYGVFDAGEIFAGEGSPAPDPAADSSLARRFANLDSDDNAADFEVLGVPTPGSAPLSAIPEPRSAALLALGISLLARVGSPRVDSSQGRRS